MTAEPRVSAEADAEVGGAFESTSETSSLEALQTKLVQLEMLAFELQQLEAIELESLSPAVNVHPKHLKHSMSKTIVMGCCVEESRGCNYEKFEVEVGV